VSHVGTLNEMLRDIDRHGYVFAEVEAGLYYFAGITDRFEDPSSLFAFAREKPVTYFNTNRMDRVGYWPMPLLLGDVGLTSDFLVGRLGIVVALDRRRLERLFAERRLVMSESEQEEGYAFSLRRAGEPESEWGFPHISEYFFGRIGGEFVGLTWFVDTAAEMVAWAESKAAN
jgi:hypothetical protein